MVEQDEKIALAYYQTIPQVIKVNGHEYLFGVRANICMAWVLKDDVSAVLNIVKVCCGGNKRHVYRYASEDDVRRWTNGGGR